MKLKKIGLTVVFLLATFPWPIFASRIVFVPSYLRRVNAKWATTTPAGPIGYAVQYLLRINNISSTPQSGTIKFLPGTIAIANQDSPSGGLRSPSFDVKYLICTNGTSVSSPFTQPPGNPTNLSAGTWTIGPNTSIQLVMMAVFKSIYSTAPNGPGHDASDSLFEPIVKLVINEDQGALTAMITSLVESLGNLTLCDGTSVSFPGMSFPSAGVEIPLLVNAGRPF